MATELEVEVLLQKAVDEIVASLGLLGGVVFLKQRNTIYAQSISAGRISKKFTKLIGTQIKDLSISTNHPQNLVAKCVRDNQTYSSDNLYDFTVGVLNRVQTSVAQTITSTDSAMVFPLVSQSEVVGALFLSSHKAKTLEEARPVIETIATNLAIAIKNSLLFAEVRESNLKVTAALGELNNIRKNEKERISILVHNLKNHLTALLISTDILKNSVQSEEDLKLLEVNQDSLNQILQILDNAFIDIRSEQEEQVYQEEILISKWLQDTTDIFSTSAASKGLEFSLISEVDNNQTVTSDRLKLNQILDNLISNAIKYTPRGKVTITATSDTSGLKIIVSDTGIGIHAEELPRIGQKFFRAEKSFNATREDIQDIPDGNGLGLYAVRKYLDLIGGKLEIQSELGKGTEVTIILPLDVA